MLGSSPQEAGVAAGPGLEKQLARLAKADLVQTRVSLANAWEIEMLLVLGAQLATEEELLRKLLVACGRSSPRVIPRRRPSSPHVGPTARSALRRDLIARYTSSDVPMA